MKFKTFRFKKVESTNNSAIRIIKNSNIDYGIIIANKQKNGRGQYGKKWISYNGNLFLKDSDGTYMKFNPKTNELTTLANVDNDFQTVFQTPWMGKDLIYKNADSGETHIGENSLVTSEVNGQQLLYATDANGAKIDINISNGSDLRINNKSVSGAIASTIAMNQIEIAEEGLSVGVGLGSFAGSNKIAVGLGYAGALNENLNYVFKASTSNNEYGLGVSFNFR